MLKNDVRKANTGRFLREYRYLKQLTSVHDEPDNAPSDNRNREKQLEMVRKVIHPFDPLVEEGDIRLFPQAERITYGVVLAWDELRDLVVPLSRYDNPANDSEFYVENAGDAALFMRVYQLWNTRTVQKSLLCKTWKVGRIGTEEVARLRQMLRHRWQGEEIPEMLMERQGLSDSRLARLMKEYQHAELENFRELDRENQDVELFLDRLSSIDFSSCYGKFQSLMAAAGKETLSPVYLGKDQEHGRYLTAIEAENFHRVRAGEPLPLFCWFSEAIVSENYWRMVVFRAVQNQTLLGTGIVEPEEGGVALRLRNPVEAKDVPSLETPADIEIIILEP